MNAKLFEKWLTSLNLSMKKQNRHILLFLDNAPCHPPDVQLSNVKLQFFPTNTTSTVQPLDQGVIHSFKAHYRKSLVKHIIARSSTAQTTTDITISALDAVYWIHSACRRVTDTTIQTRSQLLVSKKNKPNIYRMECLQIRIMVHHQR